MKWLQAPANQLPLLWLFSFLLFPLLSFFRGSGRYMIMQMRSVRRHRSRRQIISIGSFFLFPRASGVHARPGKLGAPKPGLQFPMIPVDSSRPLPPLPPSSSLPFPNIDDEGEEPGGGGRPVHRKSPFPLFPLFFFFPSQTVIEGHVSDPI